MGSGKSNSILPGILALLLTAAVTLQGGVVLAGTGTPLLDTVTATGPNSLELRFQTSVLASSDEVEVERTGPDAGTVLAVKMDVDDPNLTTTSDGVVMWMTWRDELPNSLFPQLQAGQTYTYRVRVITAGVTPSDWSNAKSGTTTGGSGGGSGGGGVSGPDLNGASGWAVAEVQQAWSWGLTTDRILSNYQTSITREEFCEIAVLLYEKLIGTPAVPVDPNPFTDTANPDILKAFDLGITKGVAPDRFAPNNHITRQEICVMLYRALRAFDPALDAADPMYSVGVAPFADEHLIASWAINEVRFCNHHQIMKGVGANAIGPLGNTTREQAILLVKRTYEAFSGGTP